MKATIQQLTPADLPLLNTLMQVFGKAFDDLPTYTGKPPAPEYQQKLLGNEAFIALVAVEPNGTVVGGLAAYELPKFEQARSEIYLYDLAVLAEYRRKGVATSLINTLRRIAADRGAYVVFVQADTGIEDAAAIALYSKLGQREDVLHFDISV
ncbi:AAC(3)-I family aminoglycoside N-acetyltransferase [Saccharospirillum alexandrii]|uniref:AAC(3)-I family aminoglycoside N-acetyltransferase n=1 Tax=Saccharospirillum alexandrii TaxID=2448477 RepID=UPI000FDB4D31|nr:AAC(3)-I family aminoglycoside N-acetyltransferase [Saccharospirillum alexandrii]